MKKKWVKRDNGESMATDSLFLVLDKMLEKKLTRKIHTLLIKMELKMDIKWVFWNVWKEWKIAVVGELLVLNG